MRKAIEFGYFGSDTLQMILMILAQIMGALFSMFLFFELLEITTNGKLDDDEFPHLKNHTGHWAQGMSIEMFSTFMFASGPILVKDPMSSQVTGAINRMGVDFMGCFIIGTGLAVQILVAGPHTSASLNPAVSIAQTVLVKKFLDQHHFHTFFFRIYILGPVFGAILAGLMSWANNAGLKNHGPADLAENERKSDEALRNKGEGVPEGSAEEKKGLKADPEAQ